VKYVSIYKVLELIGGGSSKLRKLMIKADQNPPSLGTVSAWKTRGVIGTDWVGCVIWTCALQGIDPLLLLDDF
jgi:hypothetical protein